MAMSECAGAPRDVAAFDERAHGYEQGWRGRLHHEIAEKTALLALSTAQSPGRVLDLGCGTGYLLRRLAREYPDVRKLAGIDAAATMIEVAEGGADDARLHFLVGVAEQLPYPDGSFELVVSSTSFDHWSDQQKGLVECRRVLTGGGQLVLVDQFSALVAGHPYREPAGNGSHQEAGRPAPHHGRIQVRPLARPLRHHHQSSDGDGLRIPAVRSFRSRRGQDLHVATGRFLENRTLARGY